MSVNKELVEENAARWSEILSLRAKLAEAERENQNPEPCSVCKFSAFRDCGEDSETCVVCEIRKQRDEAQARLREAEEKNRIYAETAAETFKINRETQASIARIRAMLDSFLAASKPNPGKGDNT